MDAGVCASAALATTDSKAAEISPPVDDSAIVREVIQQVLKKHPEFDEITDPVTAEVRGWALTRPSN